VLPLLVWLIKPKFATRTDLMVGESFDKSMFEDSKAKIVPEAASVAK